MIKKFLTIFILSIAITAVVSGCKKKPANQANQSGNIPDINNQSNFATTSEEQAPPEEIIKYLENGEVDTSGWKTYRNEVLKLEMKYPPFLVVSTDQNSKILTISSYVINKETNQRFDNNWFIVFGKIVYHENMTPEQRRDYIIENIKLGNSNFSKIGKPEMEYEIINIDQGYIVYNISYTPGGYRPEAIVITKCHNLQYSMETYSDTTDFSQYDPKYINIFKAVLKTISFDE